MNYIDGLYCYDLECVLFEKNSGNILKQFKARQITARELNVGTVLGGIASYSQSMQLATLELDSFDIQPKNHKIKIGEQTYHIRNISTTASTPPWNKSRQRIEKVLSLE